MTGFVRRTEIRSEEDRPGWYPLDLCGIMTICEE